jgi:thiol peroxidase
VTQERTGVVTMQGSPLTLLGPELKAGDAAPDFTAVDRKLDKVGLSDLKGKTVLISAVPSVDTSVCSLQTQRFNKEAASLPDNVVVVTISQDLPFALDRFCGAEGIENLHVLSDHVDASFGLAYGVLIKELRLLARSVFVVGSDGKLKYLQIVPEVTEHPDYDAALRAVRKAAGSV